MQHIEKLTWAQFVNSSRKNGVTHEKSGNQNFNLIHEQNSSQNRIVEWYYFHFRVEQTGKFRVFGYQRDQFFCITHIDPSGKINH